MSEQSPRRCFWTIHMTQSKVYSYRALYIYIHFNRHWPGSFFCFYRLFFPFSLSELLHMHNISCHTLLEAFLTSLFVHSILWGCHRKKKKKLHLFLSECPFCLDDYLHFCLMFSFHFDHFHIDRQVLIVSFTPLFASSVKLRSYLNVVDSCHAWGWEVSLATMPHIYTHTYSPLLSLPRSQPPLPLSFSRSPSCNLLVFLETLAVSLKCLSVTCFAATTENSDWIRQEGVTTKLFFLATWMWQWFR